MNGLPSIFVGLLRLRTGPQDLPYSWTLTVMVIAAYLGEGLYTGYQLGNQLGDDSAALKNLVATVLQFSAVVAMLFVRGYQERLAQTLCALAGTAVILDLLAFPFLLQADPGQRNQFVLALIYFGIFFWSIAVAANIYRHALSVNMSQGVLIAVLIIAASYVLMEAAF